RHLLVDLVRGETGGVGRYDEAAYAVVGLRPDDRHVRDRAVGDPHLGTVEDPVAGGVALGVGAHAAGIGAVVGFGEPEAADRFARRHAGQPFGLLLGGAVLPDGEHGQRALHRYERPDARVAGFQFSAGDAVGDGV